jgi:hypothetical protein
MGLYFKLVNIVGRKKDEATPIKLRQEKLKASLTIAEDLSDYFTPETVEMWSKTPLEELGGDLLSTYESFEIFKKRVLEEEFTPRLDSIFRIIGKWNIANDSKVVSGYFSINYDSTWTNAYGDLNADIYPTVAEDLTDLIFESGKASSIWRDILEKCLDTDVGKSWYKIHSIILSEVIPEDGPELISMFYSKDKSLIWKFALNHLENTNPKLIEDRKPYDKEFIVRTLESKKGAPRNIRDNLLNKLSVKFRPGSAEYYSETRNQVGALIEGLSEHLKDAYNSLESRANIKNKIYRAFGETTLSDKWKENR